MGRIESTYKARDVEEVVDIYLYRPWGYALAVLAHRLKMTPNQVTVIGMVVGSLAGPFFFFDDLGLNLIGIGLWMFGQALDGADGQLARMADMRSRLGRMLDGIADNAKFTSLYIALGLRLVTEMGTGWAFLIAVVAGVTHSYQSALADFYRNAYLFFVVNPQKAEQDSSKPLWKEYAALRWHRNPIQKLLMRAYITYTTRQERWCGGSLALQRRARRQMGGDFPEELRETYRRLNRPLLKYYNADDEHPHDRPVCLVVAGEPVRVLLLRGLRPEHDHDPAPLPLAEARRCGLRRGPGHRPHPRPGRRRLSTFRALSSFGVVSVLIPSRRVPGNVPADGAPRAFVPYDAVVVIALPHRCPRACRASR